MAPIGNYAPLALFIILSFIGTAGKLFHCLSQTSYGMGEPRFNNQERLTSRNVIWNLDITKYAGTCNKVVISGHLEARGYYTSHLKVAHLYLKFRYTRVDYIEV